MRNYKTPEEHKTHFKERLFERHGIQISDQEYDKLCSKFTGVIRTGGNKTFGYITVNNHKVWCLRYIKEHLLVTVYADNYDHCTIEELIKTCIRRKARELANSQYRRYSDEWINAPKFETIKDAALYFVNNTTFKTLHIDHYKHGNVDKFKLLHRILKNINKEQYEHRTRPKLSRVNY